ncbi:VWA domain-containing protein [Streptomyces bikiniensis]|uniref:VWA domain-containing protein n=1 Tax=Streptomyces bikiniensis TaxID=1896 RepID=UPI0007C6585A|nr:VWA domain-containing protein [Streptomyces bikiniensis]
MGIRSMLRKVFGRDREDSPATSVPPQSRETAEPVASVEPVTPQEAAEAPGATAAPDAPHAPEEEARRAADDLVAASFDNPQVPKARKAEPEPVVVEEQEPEPEPEPVVVEEPPVLSAAAEAAERDAAAASAASVEVSLPEERTDGTGPAPEVEAVEISYPEDRTGPKTCDVPAAPEPGTAEKAPVAEDAPETGPEAPATTEVDADAPAEPEATATTEAAPEERAAVGTDEPRADAPVAAGAEPETRVEGTPADDDTPAEPATAEATAPEAEPAPAQEPAPEATAPEAETAPAPEAAEPEATAPEAGAALAPQAEAASVQEPAPVAAAAPETGPAAATPQAGPEAPAAAPEPEATAPVPTPETPVITVLEPEVPEGVAASDGVAPAAAGPALSLAGVKAVAPHLADAYKAAGAVLKKQGLTGARAAVYLVVDRSGSMRGYFKDGSVQRLAEQTVALAAHLDENAAVTAVFFSTDVDGTAELTPATLSPTGIEEINAGLGRLGRTHYHRAVEEVLAHHEKTDPARPALVVFQTDGAPDAKTAATQALAGAADRPLHWRFVAWGEEDNKAFDYLRKLGAPRTAAYFPGATPAGTAHAAFYRGLLEGLEL